MVIKESCEVLYGICEVRYVTREDDGMDHAGRRGWNSSGAGVFANVGPRLAQAMDTIYYVLLLGFQLG